MSESGGTIVVNDYAFLDLSEPTATFFSSNDRQAILLLAQGDLSHFPMINPQQGPMIVIDGGNTQPYPILALAFDRSDDLRNFIAMLQQLEEHMVAREQAPA